MKKYVYLSCLLIVSFLLAACQVVVPTPTVPAVETEDQAQQATLETLLTQQAATIESLSTMVAPTASPAPAETEVTPEATAVPEVTDIPLYGGEVTVVESYGLAFNLPVEVASGAEVTAVLPDDPNEGWPELAMPARRAVNFSGYVIPNHFHTPVIYVFAVDKLVQGGHLGATIAAELQSLLADPAFDLKAAERLPFLPPFNAAQVFHVLEQRLDSEQNSGIRFLTLYSQAIVGVDNFDIFYTYQGISADGRYYISAILPINSTLLSNEELTLAEMEAVAGDYPGYIDGMKELLIADGGASLTPTLAALDAMMMSLFCQD